MSSYYCSSEEENFAVLWLTTGWGLPPSFTLCLCDLAVLLSSGSYVHPHTSSE